MKRLSTLFWVFVLLTVAPVLVYGQNVDCLAIVKNAVEAANKLCSGMGRNQACYVSSLDAQVEADVPATLFTKSGDLLSVDNLKSLTLSPLDTKAKHWGVAILKLQANLLDSQPDLNVTLAVFGDVRINNAVDRIPSLDVTTAQTANLRLSPSKTGGLVTSFKAGTALVADGRSEDTTWLRVHALDSDLRGWISAPLVKSDGDFTTLKVVTVDTPTSSPMQTFSFKSGSKDAACGDAPDSGILIQAPKDSGTVNLTANSADITLNSTAYIQAQANDDLIISVIDGQATVTAAGKTVIVPAGTRVRVPLDADLVAKDVPGNPEPYADARMTALPLGLLPDAAAVAPALSAEAIAATLTDIQPFAGKWAITGGTASVTAACNQGDTIPAKATTFKVAEGPFDFAKMLATSSDKTLTIKSVVVKRQGAIYVADFDATVARGHFTIQVISPTLMKIERIVSSTLLKGCVASASDEVKYIGK